MRKPAIIALLLVTAGAALAFIQLDDTHVQEVLTGAIKTFDDAIHFRATGGGTNYVGVIAPASVPTSVTFKLPSADGTNGQAVVTDGSANLSFANVVGSNPTPLAFGTPGVIPVFASPELGSYAGATCPTPQVVTAIDASGHATCSAALSRNGSVWIAAAECQGTTAGALTDLPAANATPGAVAATCSTGTNTQQGVLSYTNSNNLAAQVTYFLPLNNGVGLGGFNASGTTTANIVWFSPATSGNVVWNLQTSCVAAGASNDPAWTSNTVTSAAQGTANRLQTATVTLSLGSCNPGDALHLQLARNAGSGSDTMANTANVIGIELNVARQ